MRILFLNRFFWPDTAATGQLLYDLAEHLAASGETVHVICGSANYGGSNNAPRPRVGITRLKKASFSTLVAGRVGSYLSFFAGALWHGFRHQPPDLVVTLTDPPLLSLAGMAIQRWRGARHIVWEMDLYPDIAVDLGVLRANGLLAKIFGWLADLPRRRADRVIVLGNCMQSRLLAHGIPESKIYVAENWADRDAPSDRNRDAQPPQAEGLSIVYSGNFGRAHDAVTIAQTMAELKQGEGFRFIFAGGGSRQAWLRDFCRKNGVENVQFLPYCERAELNERLTSGHVGLVTQQPASAGSVVPSKTCGILAAGRPVLFIGPRESTTARIIARYSCGWRIDCGDVRGLTALLRCLRDNKELIATASARAHQAFIGHYQRSLGVARVAAILKQAAEGKTSAAAQEPSLAK